VFLPPVALLVFSTMALRYHFFCDVVAGALLALPAFWLCDWLMRRDEGSAGEQAQPPAAQTT
jgi:membrane-associated phospholipid phosphatase